MKNHPILNALQKGIKQANVEKNKVCISSDVFYSPEEVSFLGVDFFKTHRGRSLPISTRKKQGKISEEPTAEQP